MPDTEVQTIDRPEWLPTDVWPFAVNTFVHDERRIHYVDHGDGPTLVLIHAGMWSFIWRDLITDLSADFRCIALDFPGAGLSGGTRRDIDVQAFSELVNDWLDFLEISNATFVVHDLGGVVGIGAAAERPERVNGLVAMNAFAWPPDKLSLRAMLRLMGSVPMTATLGSLRVIPRLSRGRFGVGRRYDSDAKTAYFGPYRRRQRARNFHRVMRSAHRSGHQFEVAEHALASSLGDRPVLTMFGEKNDQFGFADRWASYFPHATRVVIDAGNHFPMCDDPELVASTVRAWHDADVKVLQRSTAS